MDTLLVTGSNGLLGSRLIRQALGTYRVVALSRRLAANHYSDCFEFRQVDIRDAAAVLELCREVQPRAVLHTAAMTDVDACEQSSQEAWDVNVRGTENVARACRSVEARLVFLSTDYVFSGADGPYSEEDQPHPVSVYGRTKLAGERLVADICADHCIARTSTLYGYQEGARPNFVTWLVDRLRQGEAATVVTDQISSPTFVDSLAEMVLAMASGDAHGLYHSTGAEWLSRYDFALRIARCFGLDADLVRPGVTASLRQPAQRPRHSGLRTSRVIEELGVRPLTVDEGLAALRAQMEASGQ